VAPSVLGRRKEEEGGGRRETAHTVLTRRKRQKSTSMNAGHLWFAARRAGDAASEAALTYNTYLALVWWRADGNKHLPPAAKQRTGMAAQIDKRLGGGLALLSRQPQAPARHACHIEQPAAALCLQPSLAPQAAPYLYHRRRLGYPAGTGMTGNLLARRVGIGLWRQWAMGRQRRGSTRATEGPRRTAPASRIAPSCTPNSYCLIDKRSKADRRRDGDGGQRRSPLSINGGRPQRQEDVGLLSYLIVCRRVARGNSCRTYTSPPSGDASRTSHASNLMGALEHTPLPRAHP